MAQTTEEIEVINIDDSTDKFTPVADVKHAGKQCKLHSDKKARCKMLRRKQVRKCLTRSANFLGDPLCE